MQRDTVRKGSFEKTNYGLKREIGLISGVNFIINIVIGSGIFITPGKVLEECGSVGAMLLVWVLCGVAAFLTCLPFGELSTVVPKSGSMYIYLQTAFGSYHPFFGELPAFVFFWIVYIVVFPSTAAVNAILFSDYSYETLQVLVSEKYLCDGAVMKNILGASAIVLVGIMNCVSVKLYIKSQDILTYIKMAIVVFTVCCGLYMFLSGKSNDFDPGFKGTNLSFSGLSQAMYFGLYAYDGGSYITGITEELKNPEKNIMYSIIIALVITTATYLSLNVTFLSVLTPAEMANGTTVISDFAKKTFGQNGCIIASSTISLCLLLSIMSGIFLSSRLGYVAAREGHVAEILCCIHKTKHTPAPAVVVQVVLSLIWFFAGRDVTLLIDFYGCFMWLSYGVTMVALFTLRKKFPDAYRPFKVPSAIPFFVAVMSFCLVIVSLLITGLQFILVFAVCFLSIFLVYYVLIYRAYKIKYYDTLQKNLQDWFMLEPLVDESKSKLNGHLKP